MSLYNQVFYVACLVFVGGFFSMAEISLAAARKSRLQALADDGNKRAEQVLKMQEAPGRFFSVLQVVLNMVAILGGIVGEAAFSPFFSWCYSFFLPPHMVANAGFITSFLIVTLSFVIFADLLPKRLSISNPERWAMVCVGPMLLLSILFRPIVYVLESFTNVVLRLFGVPLKRMDHITSADILASVNAGTAAGLLAPSEQAVIENVFNLENRLVTTAMTARESIIYFMLNDDEEEIRKKLTAYPHSYFLVCDGTLDQVVGFIDSKDILNRLLDAKSISLNEPGLVRPVQFVPDTLTLSEILEVFQRSRTDFSVVLNEYALVVGLLTLNDVMSTVMGDLVLTPEESQIIERDDNSWLVDGATPTVDMMHILEIDELPEEQAYETAAGFMMFMLRKIPRRADKFDWNGYRFEVIDVDANKIDQILVTRLSPDKADKAEEKHSS